MRTSVEHVMLSPDELDNFGTRAQQLAADLEGLEVDPSLLTDEVVGHAGLAQSLRDFSQEYGRRLDDFQTHLKNLGADVGKASMQYSETDNAIADELARLRPGETREKRSDA